MLLIESSSDRGCSCETGYLVSSHRDSHRLGCEGAQRAGQHHVTAGTVRHPAPHIHTTSLQQQRRLRGGHENHAAHASGRAGVVRHRIQVSRLPGLITQLMTNTLSSPPPLAQQPNACQGRRIMQVSRSHKYTPQSVFFVQLQAPKLWL